MNRKTIPAVLPVQIVFLDGDSESLRRTKSVKDVDEDMRELMNEFEKTLRKN